MKNAGESEFMIDFSQPEANGDDRPLGAAAQKEDNEEDGNWNPDQPEQ